MFDWKDSYIALPKGVCSNCRQCCSPSIDGFLRLDLMENQITTRTYLHEGLQRDLCGWILPEGCKANKGNGCILPRNQRPVACNIWPFALFDKGVRLIRGCPPSTHIDVSCPSIKKIGSSISSYLRCLDEEFLLRLNSTYDLAPEDYFYSDFHVPVF